MATKFTSMTELFASLDTPMMLEPVEFNRKQPTLEKLGLRFDDNVSRATVFGIHSMFGSSSIMCGMIVDPENRRHQVCCGWKIHLRSQNAVQYDAKVTKDMIFGGSD